MRIHQAIAWVRLLLAGLIRDPLHNQMPVQRWAPVTTRLASERICIRTDASPFGFGAILFLRGAPVAWIAEEWADCDIQLLQATRGDPAWQAEWEFMGLLIAVDTWLPVLRGRHVCIFQLDATAALHAAAKRSGNTPLMNAIAAELALRLEGAATTVLPEHLPGTLNFRCDALSRLAQGASVPQCLRHVRRDQPRARLPPFFWGWPRSLALTVPSPWAAATPAAACGPGASGKGEVRHSPLLARPPSSPRSSRGKAREDDKEEEEQEVLDADRFQ